MEKSYGRIIRYLRRYRYIGSFPGVLEYSTIYVWNYNSFKIEGSFYVAYCWRLRIADPHLITSANSVSAYLPND